MKERKSDQSGKMLPVQTINVSAFGQNSNNTGLNPNKAKDKNGNVYSAYNSPPLNLRQHSDISER